MLQCERAAQGSEFHRDAGALADATHPQHNLRLDAKALEGRHYHHASCRDFRDAVLGVLPHRRGAAGRAVCAFADARARCWSWPSLLGCIPCTSNLSADGCQDRAERGAAAQDRSRHVAHCIAHP